MGSATGADGVGAGGFEAGAEAEVSTVVELNGWAGRGCSGGGVAMVSLGIICGQLGSGGLCFLALRFGVVWGRVGGIRVVLGGKGGESVSMLV